MDHDDSEVPGATEWPSRGMPAASAQGLVAAVYRALLLREPDEAGLADWSRLLASGDLDLEAMLRRTLAGGGVRRALGGLHDDLRRAHPLQTDE